MKIALDVDGVLLDTMKCFCEIYNFVRHDNKTKNDITRFGFNEDWGMSEAEFWAVFEFCNIYDLKSIDNNAHKYIKKLAKKHEIDIVTARKKTERNGVKRALTRLGLKQGVHYNKIVLTLKEGIESKIELDYEIYIDDNPNLAKDIIKKPYYEPKDYKQMLLWQQPWNWRIESGNGVQRVRGWKDIMKWFKNNNL